MLFFEKMIKWCPKKDRFDEHTASASASERTGQTKRKTGKRKG
jgi:hypothetical protein